MYESSYNMRPRCCFLHLLIILSAVSAEINDQDIMALQALRAGFISGGSPPEDSALSSWNTSTHFCQWLGVTCGKRHQRVTAINLFRQNLNGVLSPSLGNLTFLIKLNLTHNSLRGEIPTEVGRLWRLRYLRLGVNSLEGQIPAELGNCSNLLELGLTNNKLTGRIPFQLGSLLKLTLFFVGRNNIGGDIPSSFRNLTSLNTLVLRHNEMRGEIGDSLRGLSNLNGLSLASNNFSGSIAPLYNLSSLEVFEITENHFTGTIRPDIDVAFPKLIYLSVTKNRFTGTIPASLSNISGLTVIQMSRNGFTGLVPDSLGKLKNLNVLHLAINNLGSRDRSNDLMFIDSLTNCTNLKWLVLGVNRFNGQLPNSIANFTYRLEVIHMSTNYISGRIPEWSGRLSGLTVFDLGNNLFTGTIPNSVGTLGNLSFFNLAGNMLRGEIPSSLGNLTNLIELYLHGNFLDGSIPADLANCRRMLIFDISSNLFRGSISDEVFNRFEDLRKCNLSSNSFDGPFPSIFGNLEALNVLDVSHNNFSGNIPAQFGTSLEYLNMSGNSFQGNILPSFGNSKGLKQLDLSLNNLSGPFPEKLVLIRGLEILNLSFNQLQGKVPLFRNSTKVLLRGNTGLCGSGLELDLQPCLITSPKKRKLIIIVVALSVFTIVLFLALLFIVLHRRKKHKNESIDGLPEGHQRVSYAELFKATEGFAESNLVGAGSFGNVYRGILDGDEGKPVAVKVLNLSNHGAAKSFSSECKVLRRIRHRNLLKIITSCSSLDHQRNDFKALVYDFMSNGNLDNWLHFSDVQLDSRVLTLAKRLEIAIDVGSALDYLHNGCEPPVIHCDLKPSNILLDDDMVAHVGDFGLAKLLQGATGNLSGRESLSSAIKGSIGYIAPEYGMGAAISPEGDIYSYGILLLELVTGKRPTDDMFSNEMSLPSFVEKAVPEEVEDIVDQCLMNEICEATAAQGNQEQIKLEYITFLVSFAEVGISCSAQLPRDRMDIQSATKCLSEIKCKYDSIQRRLL